MRFVIAQMKHETHSFNPLPTSLADFNPFGAGSEPLTGEAAVAVCRERKNSALSAYINILDGIGADYVLPMTGEAWPAGPVEDSTFDYMCEKITSAVQEGCDAVLLDLHGSMVTESYDDAEGELLRRIRAVAPDIPIAVALDLHSSMTDKMIDNATVITLYRTTPHVDMYETGERAAKTLLGMLKGETQPVMVTQRIPLLISLEKTGETEFPMKDVMDKVRELEEGDNDILNASLAVGHPLTDSYPSGMTAVIMVDAKKAGDSAEELACKAAEEVLTIAWENRDEFIFHVEPYEETLKKVKSLSGGPIIMGDSGDIAASGGFAADVEVLREAIRIGLDDMLVGLICDAESIQKMAEAGVGNEVTLDLGGKTSAPLCGYHSESLRITGRVRALVDGRIECTGAMLKGLKLNIGRMAVLSTDTMDIVITERRMEALDLAMFTHVGIDPREKSYVLIKSRQHFRAAFKPIAKHLVRVAGPGITNPDFSALPFSNIERPVFPLEMDTPFRLVKMGG